MYHHPIHSMHGIAPAPTTGSRSKGCVPPLNLIVHKGKKERLQETSKGPLHHRRGSTAASPSIHTKTHPHTSRRHISLLVRVFRYCINGVTPTPAHLAPRHARPPTRTPRPPFREPLCLPTRQSLEWAPGGHAGRLLNLIWIRGDQTSSRPRLPFPCSTYLHTAGKGTGVQNRQTRQRGTGEATLSLSPPPPTPTLSAGGD